MKQLASLIIIILSGIWFPVKAQVGISTDGSAPHSSAILETKSTNRGFLPPRMTTQQRDNIVSPAAGLVIYNTSCHDLQFYDGGSWVPLGNFNQVSAPGWINGDPDPCIGQAGVNYSVSMVPGATGYHWSVPPDAVITSGQGTDAILVNMGSTEGFLCVTALNDCGRSEPFCQFISLLPVPAPPVATITVSENPVCNQTPVSFIADVSYMGSVDLFAWYVNGSFVSNGMSLGSNGNIFDHVPDNGDQVFCRITTSDACFNVYEFSTDTITMTVLPTIPVTITINASATSVCSGHVVTFNSSVNNGGTSPEYQWKKNNVIISGATGSTYAYSPANNDVITCSVYSSLNCALPSPAVSAGVTMSVQSSLSKSHVAGTVAPVSKTVTYGLVSNIAGEPSKCWITRNLGASQQATSVSDNTEASAGWYWQFNRKQGYRHTGSALTPAWTITSINENSNWTSANDPCSIELGTPWRIPTYTEWYNIDDANGWTSWTAPFNSPLKLHAAGNLSTSNGSLSQRGGAGYFWSQTQSDNTSAWAYTMLNGISWMSTYSKPAGFSVRCLKQ